MGVALHPEFAGGPGGIGDAGLEVFHLKPVFNINGQEKVVGVIACFRLCVRHCPIGLVGSGFWV